MFSFLIFPFSNLCAIWLDVENASATHSSAQLGWLDRFFFENSRNIPLPVFLLMSLSLLPPLFTLLPLIVDCASLSLELSADIRDMDDDVSCCNDSGRVFVASKRVLPQPKSADKFNRRKKLKLVTDKIDLIYGLELNELGLIRSEMQFRLVD